MAYVLGFFTADGNLTINPRGGHYIEFTSCDRVILERIKKLLDSEHKISKRVRHNPKWKDAYRFQIGSKKVFNDLVNLGLSPRKSNSIKFLKVPNEFLGDFIRGYFDGDGNVSFGRYWRKDRQKWYYILSTRFTSGSIGFLKGLKESLKSYIFGGGIYEKNRGGYDLEFSLRDSIALYNLMYNNISSDLYLNRKYKIFKKALNILGA